MYHYPRKICMIVAAHQRNWSGTLRCGDCTDENSATSTTKFFHRACCGKHEKHNSRETGLFKEEFCCAETICLCIIAYDSYNSQSNKPKNSSKRLKKSTLEDSGDGPLSKHRNVSEEVVRVTSTIRGFRTIQHPVATYEQTKKGLSYFQPIRNVQQNGIQIVPLNICLYTVYYNVSILVSDIY